jgi:hypothetical protein
MVLKINIIIVYKFGSNMSTQDDNKTTADLKKEPKSALKDKPGKFSNQKPYRRFDLLLQNILFFGY